MWKRSRGILAMPAGKAMKVRTTGSRRARNTVIDPYFKKEVRGAVQVAPAEQNIAAEALHQRAAAMCPHPIGDGRTQVAADGARRGHPKKLTCRCKPGSRRTA